MVLNLKLPIGLSRMQESYLQITVRLSPLLFFFLFRIRQIILAATIANKCQRRLLEIPFDFRP